MKKPKRYRYPLRHRLRKLWCYFKGLWWCRRFHRPIRREMSGYGGVNHWGRSRRAPYWPMWCVKCGNRWDTIEPPKRLTVEQRKACKKAYGDMWSDAESGDPLDEGTAMLRYLEHESERKENTGDA